MYNNLGIGASHHFRKKLKYKNKKETSYFHHNKETEQPISSIRKNDFHFSKREEILPYLPHRTHTPEKKLAAAKKEVESTENFNRRNETRCEKCTQSDTDFFITMSMIFCLTMKNIPSPNSI